MKDSYVLGIDTSNYKTSVAIVDRQGQIVCDIRSLLKVKQGEKGLRQSDALFQHIENLPELIEEAMLPINHKDIAAVAYSDRPRPVQGSYMPVFKAGSCVARSTAAALKVPCFAFSHQQGHIEAVKRYSGFCNESQFLCYHLSGGTCELLKIDGNEIEIIGGSKDISFGQLIDRIGVKLGMSFPAGEAMDRIAFETEQEPVSRLKRVSRDSLHLNLSGMETQAVRLLDEMDLDMNKRLVIKELFNKIAGCLCELTEAAVEKTDIKRVLFTGGVSSSVYISNNIVNYFSHGDILVDFGKQTLSQDNAVGIAMLGGMKVWQ